MKLIHVKKLTTQFVTRDRGGEAFYNLPRLGSDSITIDLSNVQILSFTFLDEIILRALNADMLNQLIFLVDDKFILAKLARIARLRDIHIVVRSSSTRKRHRIRPRTFTRIKSIFVGAKGSMKKVHASKRRVSDIKRVHIGKLTTRFITRERATEAFNNLALREFASISVSLNNVVMLAYPFLDEVILRASKAGMLKKIIFRVDNEFILYKLAYIAGTRKVDIMAINSKYKNHRIQPKTFTRQKTTFIGAKGNIITIADQS